MALCHDVVNIAHYAVRVRASGLTERERVILEQADAIAGQSDALPDGMLLDAMWIICHQNPHIHIRLNRATGMTFTEVVDDHVRRMTLRHRTSILRYIYKR